MRTRTRIVAAAALLSLVAAASATGVSRQIGALDEAAATTQASLDLDTVRLPFAKKVTKFLAKPGNANSLAAELASVAKAAKVVETKLADQADLYAAFDEARGGYAADLAATRANILAATTSGSLSAKARKRYAATLRRFDRTHPALPAKRSAAPTPITADYVAYAKAAKAGAGLTPYDAGTTNDWVIQLVDLAPAGQGVDLDGDGKPDNALATAQSLFPAVDIGQMFQNTLFQGGQFALIEMWYVGDITKPDPFVLAGVLGATDGDGDDTNDFSGTGVFAVDPAGTDADGHPLLRTATSLAKGGKYEIELAGETIALAGFTLPPGAKLVIQGTATPDWNAGHFGFAIPVQGLIDFLATQGLEIPLAQQPLVALLADIDLDGDGTNDAISASLTFSSVTAVKTAP